MLKPLQRTELKRTRGLEAKAVNIGCLSTFIRSPRVHVLLSLTATCQLCLVSQRMGRSIYIQYIPEVAIETFYVRYGALSRR